MTLSRVTMVASALLSAALLAGCSDPDPEPSAASATPTPTATVAAAGQWAGGVCSATAALQDSVRAVSSTVEFDPSASAGALDQARAQVRERVDAVKQSAASLRTALSAAPAEAGPELTAAQQELQSSAEQTRQAVDQLSTAAGQVADAQTAAERAISLVSLKAAVGAATAGLATYLDTLRTGISGSGQAVRDAFAAEPSCQELTTPSPSAST